MVISKFTAKKTIPFMVALAMFMEAVDTNVLNTAIPSMSISLQVNPIDLKIALISYLLSLAVFIPISGWLADKFGIKNVFMTALGIFIFSSFWCGFSKTLMELVIARSLQGIGGSIMLPVGRLIIVRTFQRHELITTMNRVVMVGALGIMLGPVLGGLITHFTSWRWIFWVNIPIGIFNILLVQFLLKDVPPKSVPPLDKLGFIYFGLSLASFILGLSLLSNSNATHLFSISLLLASFCLLGIYIFHSRNRVHPIVKTELFSSRPFRVSVLGSLFARIGFGGIPFLMPLLLQIAIGFSPQMSGFLIAPLALGVLLMKYLTLPLLRLFGYKRLLMVNTIFVGILLWSFTFINQLTPTYMIAILIFLFGVLISLQYSSMNSLAYAEMSHDYFSSATSILSTLQQVSQSMGVAIAAMCLRYFSFVTGSILTVQVFHDAFFAMGILTFFSSLIFIQLDDRDGHEMIEPAD